MTPIGYRILKNSVLKEEDYRAYEVFKSFMCLVTMIGLYAIFSSIPDVDADLAKITEAISLAIVVTLAFFGYTVEQLSKPIITKGSK